MTGDKVGIFVGGTVDPSEYEFYMRRKGNLYFRNALGIITVNCGDVPQLKRGMRVKLDWRKDDAKEYPITTE